MILADSILHVIRCFNNENVTHVDGSINPVRDAETIEIELLLADLETLEKQIYMYIQYQSNDSVLISLYEQKLDLLDTRVELYKDLSKEIQPKWYENKFLWFGYGVALTAGSVILAGQLGN